MQKRLTGALAAAFLISLKGVSATEHPKVHANTPATRNNK